MKRFFKMMGLMSLTVILTLVSVFALTGCGGKETIAVMAKGETHAFWQAVKSGAEAAGEKYGYKVTFRGPPTESAADIPKQKEQVSQAINDKNTKALVIATIGSGFGDFLTQAKSKNMPVVEFDSGIYTKTEIPAGDKNPIVSSVATSNSAAAAVAAEEFYKGFIKAKLQAQATGKYTVGVIQHDGSQTGIDRATGFKTKLEALATADSLNDKLTVTIDQRDNTQGAYKLALDQFKEAGVKAVFMSNEGVVKEVKDTVFTNKSGYADMTFCGYDAGTAQIDWMRNTDTTIAKLFGAVAQDSFQIGYQAVEQAAKALKGETVTAKVNISGAWWNAENVDEMIAKNLVYKG